MKMVRKHFIFSGQVQGGGFRYSAQYLAQSLGLTGWVKNEWDGTVVVEAQGEEKALEQFVEKLGSRSFIRVDHVISAEIPVEQESGFHVR